MNKPYKTIGAELTDEEVKFEPPPMFDRVGYGAALVAMMARRCKSYRQVARIIGVSPSKLCRIGRAKSVPDVETYLRINAWIADRPIHRNSMSGRVS